MHCDRGLIVVFVYYFKTWNKKDNIYISRVMSSHMGPIYIETSNIIISRVLSSHIGLMYIEKLYITSSRVISSPMGPMNIVTPYIIFSRFISSHMGPMYIETLFRIFVSLCITYRLIINWIFESIILIKVIISSSVILKIEPMAYKNVFGYISVSLL